MKFLYATVLLFAAFIFKVSAQEAEVLEKIDPKFDLKISPFLCDSLKITPINPFEDLKPYAQLRSLEDKNGRVIPLNREIHFNNPQEQSFMDPMPMAKLEGYSNMPFVQFDNDKNYTLLIKPFK